jgi:hypothetical protein
MALIEVEESDLARRTAAVNLLERLGSKPGTRARLMALVKEAVPEAVIPEVDATNSVMEEMKLRDKRIDELTAKIEGGEKERQTRRSQRELDGQVEKGRAQLREANYTDEGIAAIEKLMTEEGITNYAAAAAYFDQKNPPEAPVSPYGGTRWDFGKPAEGDTEQKNWLSDPVGQSQREIKNWMNENRSQMRARR